MSTPDREFTEIEENIEEIDQTETQNQSLSSVNNDDQYKEEKKKEIMIPISQMPSQRSRLHTLR